MNDFYVRLDRLLAAELFELTDEDYLNQDDWFIGDRDCALFSIVSDGYHFQHFGYSSEYAGNSWVELSYLEAKTAISVSKRMNK